jgi:exodeoxyribonuclease-3
MKFISWNVNGINSTLKKGLIYFIDEQNADIYCFQETKTNKKRANKKLLEIPGYENYWSSASKKGYSGVVSYSKEKPINISDGIGVNKFDNEGRVLTLEFKSFFVLNVYFVNAGRNLERLEDKEWFNNEFLLYCEELRQEKDLIIGGDFNVAHEEKDLANPDQNTRNAGFTMEEREWFTHFLEKGYIDTFREFEKEGDKFTYWTYRYNAREKNIGWRIDYWIVNSELKRKLKESYRLRDIMGSDHCPIALKMDIEF